MHLIPFFVIPGISFYHFFSSNILPHNIFCHNLLLHNTQQVTVLTIEQVFSTFITMANKYVFIIKTRALHGRYACHKHLSKSEDKF